MKLSNLILLCLVAVLFYTVPILAQAQEIDTRLRLEELTCDPGSGTGTLSFWVQCRTASGTSYDIDKWQNALFFNQDFTDQVNTITFSDRLFPLSDYSNYDPGDETTWPERWSKLQDPNTGGEENVWIRIIYQYRAGTRVQSPANDDWWDVVKVTVNFNLSSDLGEVNWDHSTMPPVPPTPPIYTIFDPQRNLLHRDELDELSDIPLNCFGEYHSTGKTDARYDYNADTYVGSAVDGENINDAPDDPFPEGDGVSISGQAGETVNFDLNVNIPSGTEAYLMAWVDWDESNTMDPGEEVWGSPQNITSSGTQSYSVDIPGATSPGNYWIRFRLANSDDPANASEPTGYYPVDGEIQDEELQVQTPDEIDIEVTKTVQGGVTDVVVGEHLTYDITVTNYGPAEATNVYLYENWIYNMDYHSHTTTTPPSGATSTYDPGSYEWFIDAIGVGESATLSIEVSFNTPGTYTNSAGFDHADQADTDPTNDVGTAPPVNVAQQEADLEIIKGATPTIMEVGDQTTMTLTCINHGPEDASSIDIWDMIPAGFTLNSQSGDGSYASNTWTIPSLTSGSTAQIDLVLDAVTAGYYTNWAIRQNSTPIDPNWRNDRDTETLIVLPQQPVDLAVTKTVSPEYILVGETATFTVTVSKTSFTDQIYDIQVQDILPAGVVLQSATPSQGTYDSDPTSNTYGIWNVGDLTSNGSATLDLEVTAGHQGSFANLASLESCDPADNNQQNNSDVAILNVGPDETDLTLTKDANPTNVETGDQVVFTLQVSNPATGQSVDGVHVTDFPKTGFTYVSHSSSSGHNDFTWDQDQHNWNIGTLATGETAVIEITVLAPDQIGTYRNCGVISRMSLSDPNIQDNVDCVDVTVVQGGEPSFEETEKTDSWIDNDSDGTLSIGDQIDYTISILNSGSAPGNNVVFTDVIPTNTDLVAGSINTTQGTIVTQDPIEIDIGTMDAGATVTVTFSVTLTADVSEISNQGAVDSDETDSEDTDDPDTPQDDDPTVTTGPASFEETEKTDSWIDNDSDGTLSVGDQIDYTISIINTGGQPANNVFFTDPIPTNTNVVGGSVTTTQGTVQREDPIEIQIGTMDAGATVTVTFSVTLTANVSQIENQGEVDSDETDAEPTDDPDTGQDDDPTVTTSGASFQETEKTDSWIDNDSDGTISVGDQIDYTITIVNSGGEAANNVVFTDDIPANTDLVAGSISTTQGTIVSQEPTIQIDIGTMDAGTTVTVTFSVTVTADVSQIENQGSVDSDDTEPEPTDDPDTGQDDDPTVTRPGAGGVIDSMLRLIQNDQSEGPGGRGHLTFEVVAWATDGNTYNITLYDPVIEFDATLPTLNPVFTYSDQYFSNYTGVGNETEDLMAQTITFGYEYSGTGSMLTISDTEQRILLVQIDYDIVEGETGCIQWAQPHVPNASYEVLGEMSEDLTGALHDDPDLCPVEYPIELSAFQAQVHGGMVVLNWVTQSETNNLGFYVYRSESKEGDYQRVNATLIPGAGNADRVNHYTFTDNDITVGKTYYYKLADVNYNGKQVYHGPISVQTSLPEKFSLEQNFPNPFNPETTIRFHLRKPGHCTLSIYNMKGQKVRTLVSQNLNPGSHSVIWNGKDNNGRIQSSGIYIYKLKFNDRVESRMMEFIK